MDEIVSAVKMELGENGDLTRKVSIFFCRKHSGAKLKEIGERFGIKGCGGIAGKPEVGIKSRRRSAIEDDDKQA